MFDKNDLDQIHSKGIELETVEKQIENFKRGFPFTDLIKSATIGDGVEKLTDEAINDFESNAPA